MYWSAGIWGQIKQLTNPRAAAAACIQILSCPSQIDHIPPPRQVKWYCASGQSPSETYMISPILGRRGRHLDIRGRHDDTRRPQARSTDDPLSIGMRAQVTPPNLRASGITQPPSVNFELWPSAVPCTWSKKEFDIKVYTNITITKAPRQV